MESIFSGTFRPKDKDHALYASILIQQQIQEQYGVDFGQIPTTAEGKKTYSEAARQVWVDPRIRDLRSQFEFAVSYPHMLSSLNKVNGTDWYISDGAEALIGHDVLKKFELDNSTIDTFQNDYGNIDPQINEYGFRTYMPAKYKDLLYLGSTLHDPFTDTSKRISISGMDGGKTYEPVIEYEDALGIKGMSMDNRKVFLEGVQSILDRVAPGLDVRQLVFKTGYRTQADVQNNKLSVLLDTPSNNNISAAQSKIESAINGDRALARMFVAANASSNKSEGELKISVLNASGNELAKNEVRLTVGSKSVTTTVENILDMDQKQMYDLVNGARK